MTLATYDDAMREHARNVGMDRPDVAWISTPYDVWLPNPFYNGPPMPHPEDNCVYEEEGGPFGYAFEYGDREYPLMESISGRSFATLDEAIAHAARSAVNFIGWNVMFVQVGYKESGAPENGPAIQEVPLHLWTYEDGELVEITQADGEET